MRRKLVIYILSFVMGILSCFSGYKVVAVVLGTGIFIKRIVFSGHRENHFVFNVIIIAFIAGCLRFELEDYILRDKELDKYIDKPYTCYGKIIDVKPVKGNRIRLICKVGDSRVSCMYSGEIYNHYSYIGRKVLFTLYLKRNDNDFYTKSSGAGYSSSISGFLADDFDWDIILYIKRYIRIKQYHFIEQISGEKESSGFLTGILFGNTAYLENKIYNDFTDNGTAHILAVSGLHIGMLYGFYRLLYARLRSEIVTLFFFLFLFIYCTAAGWSVSVVRAAIMIVLLYAGNLTDRPYDMLTATFAASFAILMYNPFYIFTAGFQMSFLAVISISFLVPVFSEYTGIYPAMILAVQAGIGPYMMYVFHYFSLKGIIGNIPTVFLASILVPAGVIYFIVYMFTGLISVTADRFILNMSSILIAINNFLGETDFLEVNKKINSLFFVSLFYTLIFFTASEFFTVHRIRKEYILLLKTFFLLFMSVFLLSYGIIDKTL